MVGNLGEHFDFGVERSVGEAKVEQVFISRRCSNGFCEVESLSNGVCFTSCRCGGSV